MAMRLIILVVSLAVTLEGVCVAADGQDEYTELTFNKTILSAYASRKSLLLADRPEYGLSDETKELMLYGGNVQWRRNWGVLDLGAGWGQQQKYEGTRADLTVKPFEFYARYGLSLMTFRFVDLHAQVGGGMSNGTELKAKDDSLSAQERKKLESDVPQVSYAAMAAVGANVHLHFAYREVTLGAVVGFDKSTESPVRTEGPFVQVLLGTTITTYE